MSQSLQGATFHIEHILPRSHGGATHLTNLALACPGCNLHKADRVTAQDPDTGATVPLFHPRKHLWETHFNGRAPESSEGRPLAVRLSHHL